MVRKFIFSIIMVLTLFSFNLNVKADTVIFTIDRSYMDSHLNKDYINKAYELIEEYDYKYYVIEYSPFIDSIYLYLTNSDVVSVNQTLNNIQVRQFRNIECVISDSSPDGTCTDYSSIENNNYLMNLYSSSYEYYGYYDSNIDIFANSPVEFSGFYDDNIEVLQAEKFPKLKNLLNYDSWSDYETENNPNYTTVNLDDYYYVLLNLKDYSKKEAFNTNLQVKGMIGITPIYNYGTISKDDIIGNKVEDRCNLSYDDFTNYRLSILKSDLENNSIYAVKSCEDNSSFKFDNTIFDITYVTDENKDDPIVTIDGKEYHTIPYDDLPSSATKNEEENYIPGESKPLGFSDIIENVTDILSSFWSSLTSFMSLVTKCFNSLPVEIRAISITTFTIGCILGLIKILKS